MMRNVTISLDEALVRRAKVEAAKQDKSLSKYIAELVAREVGQVPGELKHSREYQAAMERALAREPFLAKDPNVPWPKREELYDRPYLRRHQRIALHDGPDNVGEEGDSGSMDSGDLGEQPGTD
jgi:hypothetical protein